jgi:peptidoglycan/xylan/chitin deacetylase (PgdA/CDA1 family)
MEGRELERFRRTIDWCSERFDFAEPGEIDALLDGSWSPGPRDRVLVTFDDGHERDFPVAEWLANRGIRATFFVVPSFIGRTASEYLRFHADHGVAAHDLAQGLDPDRTRGLSPEQLREMTDMGHRVAAHNFAHRNLGALQSREDLEYEIDRAVEAVSSLTGEPCRDFAWAFGALAHVSAAARRHLAETDLRVYSCIRGLNVPGLSPAILQRDALYPEGTLVASKAFIEGCADHLADAARAELVEWGGRLPDGP